MKNLTVSVIIPVYNVKQYLSECINSVIAQTYESIEIILVDDGSTDGSSEFCDKYEQEEKNISVIHKENGGLSDARNVGIENSTGEFVFFLDSDDYLELDAIEKLVETQIESDADIVIGNYYYTYADHEDIAVPIKNEKNIYSRKEAIRELMIGNIQTFAWGKLIRRDIAKKYKFPVGKLFEDHYWTHLIFDDSETVVCSYFPIVHYRQRDNSISYTFNLKRLDIVDGWETRINFLKENYPDMVKVYYERCAKDMLSLAWLVTRRMKQEKKQGYLIIKNFVNKHCLYEYCDAKTKGIIKALGINHFKYVVLAILYRLLEEK